MRKPCVVVNIFLKILYLIILLFFCKIRYREQRKVGTHCAHTVIVRTSQQTNVLEVTGSYYETFYLLVPLLRNHRN